MEHEEGDWKEDVKYPGRTGSKQQSESWRIELARALSKIGKERHTNPMERVAELFYADDSACLGILRFMLPQLKSVEAKVDQEEPFRLIIDLSPESEDKEDDTKEREAAE